MSPVMAAVVSDRLLDVADIVALIEAPGRAAEATRFLHDQGSAGATRGAGA